VRHVVNYLRDYDTKKNIYIYIYIMLKMFKTKICFLENLDLLRKYLPCAV
jgi:hypothetical protein